MNRLKVGALKFIQDNESQISASKDGQMFIGENTMKAIELYLPHCSYLIKHSSSMISDNYPFRKNVLQILWANVLKTIIKQTNCSLYLNNHKK